VFDTIILGLVALLGNDSFAVREGAQVAIVGLHELADVTPRCRLALRTKNLETRRRLRDILTSCKTYNSEQGSYEIWGRGSKEPVDRKLYAFPFHNDKERAERRKEAQEYLIMAVNNTSWVHVRLVKKVDGPKGSWEVKEPGINLPRKPRR